MVLSAAAPQIWFCPLDSYFRPWVEYAGSPQYMDLFAPDAPWPKAASHVNVFKVYSTWIGPASDADLKVEFADLRRRGIALALEAGAMTASDKCGKGVEGQGGNNLLKTVRRIKQDGGDLRYVGMDEPIFFWTLYTGKNACGWTVDQTVAKAAVNLRALKAEFPDVMIGDIEPLPVSAPNWRAQYQAGLEAFRKALGSPLAFFDADVVWGSPTYLDDLAAARKMAASAGVPFGVIYNGDGSERTDAHWVQTAERHMMAVESHLGSPDLVIFQSWHPYPKKLLPETDGDSFTWLVDAYFRRRTTLTLSRHSTKLEGKLIAADTGKGIAKAAINVVLSATDGKGTPTVYTAAADVPAGADTVVFGARVNQECTCLGTADVVISKFALEDTTRDFAKGLAGWGVKADAAKIEGGSLHIVAARGQSVQLNSARIPLSAAGPLTFQVSAQVSPQSAGSGYFMVAFLNAAKEIARVQIPFAAATTPMGSAKTNGAGRFTLQIPAKLAGAGEIRSNYAGSAENWPAESVTR